VRCPYCSEGGRFEVMIGQGRGDWYMAHQPSVVLPAALLSQPNRRGTLKIVKKKGEA
jgi:hypothetical protein